MKKVGSEAPAIRIKEVDDSDNVIGMSAPKLQLIVAVESMEESSKKEFISHIIESYSNHEKVQPIMVKSGDCDSTNCKNKDFFRVVYDTQNNFISKYFKDIASNFKGGTVLVDTEGQIVYIAEFSEGLKDSIGAIESVIEETTKKKKGAAHNHENWMRA